MCGDDNFIKVKDSGTNIANLIDNIQAATVPLEPLPFLLAQPSPYGSKRKKKRLLKLLLTKNDVIAVNNEFLEMFEGLINPDWYGSNKRSPIIQKNNDCTIEIYPVILEERLLKRDIQKLAETIH